MAQLTRHRIQPPGTVHAIYTAEDSVVASGFFYAAENFHDSIEAVRQQLCISNDGADMMHSPHCRDLELIFRNIEMHALFSCAQKDRVDVAARRLLHSIDRTEDRLTSLEFDAFERAVRDWLKWREDSK